MKLYSSSFLRRTCCCLSCLGFLRNISPSTWKIICRQVHINSDFKQTKHNSDYLEVSIHDNKHSYAYYISFLAVHNRKSCTLDLLNPVLSAIMILLAGFVSAFHICTPSLRRQSRERRRMMNGWLTYGRRCAALWWLSSHVLDKGIAAEQVTQAALHRRMTL